MRKLFLRLIPICIVLSLISPIVAYAHSGGTDRYGGHTNHSTGEYHYHHGYSAHDHYDMDGDGDADCPYTFTGSSSPSTSSSPKQSSTKSQSESSADSSPTLGYNFTYDELIKYKKENYNDGYEDGYEEGYREGHKTGYNLVTEELTEKYEKILKKKREKQTLIICAVCSIFIFLINPLIVSVSSYDKKKEKKETSYEKKKEISYEPQQQKTISNQNAQNNSSIIKALSYDHKVLTITLSTGTTYHYYNVPESVYKEMLNAKSKGQFYNQKIKNQYPYY